MKACFHFSWMKFIHKCGSGGSNHKQAEAAPLYYRNNNWIPNPPPCVVLLYEILATAFLNYIFYYYLIIFICHGIRIYVKNNMLNPRRITQWLFLLFKMGQNVKFFPLKEFENQKWSFQLVPISANQHDFLPFFTHNFHLYNGNNMLLSTT